MTLKNDLLNSEKNRFDSSSNQSSSLRNYNTEPIPESKSSIGIRAVLFTGFITMFVLYLFTSFSGDSNTTGTAISSTVASTLTEQIFNDVPDDKLLRDMGDWMERMGYKDLSREDLIELRRKGVTATYTSRIRELGYNPTLDEITRMAQQDVSSTFASMMNSLGYKNISIDDMIRLRLHGVTAHYTSNVHDLGYKNISVDDLIKLKDAKVSISTIKKLNKDKIQLVPIDDIVRYGISNQ